MAKRSFVRARRMLDLDDPSAVALAVAAAFSAAGLDAVLYGGLALAAFGEPRETRDADLAVASVSVEAGRDALNAAGIQSAITFTATRFGGVSISRLALIGGGKLNTLDLVTPRSQRYADAVLARGLRGQLDGQTLDVIAPEDFVLLKVLSTRDKDLEDARTVVTALRDRMDMPLLERESIALAREIPDHDVARRYASVI
jgi:Nucleotidyl transferase of unknown function (DUF2204)